MLEPWIALTIIAAVALLTIWVLSQLHEQGSRSRTASYRDEFERLLFDLEAMVTKANRLYAQASNIKDSSLLDHYHSALKMIETLLEAVKKLRAYDDNSDVLTAPRFLCRDITERLTRIETAMMRGLVGKPHEFMRAAPSMAQTVIGCHFCSRPFEAQLFGKVRVKIDGTSQEVAACVFCRQKLLTTRKARILFFHEDGEQVHWSKAKSWTPSPEYWNINRDDHGDGAKTPHLELIYSNVSHIRKPESDKES
jgi:hypothetical protein